MAQILVRNLEETIKRRLRRRAKENGRSMEEEVRVIIRSALQNGSVSGPTKNGQMVEKPGFGTRFSQHFKDLDRPFEMPAADEPVQPAKFRR
jgi:antitoxin FitA